MKFRYYITDLFDGCIKGSNDKATANIYAANCDFFVVDTETGLQICDADETMEVKEIEKPGE